MKFVQLELTTFGKESVILSKMLAFEAEGEAAKDLSSENIDSVQDYVTKLAKYNDNLKYGSDKYIQEIGLKTIMVNNSLIIKKEPSCGCDYIVLVNRSSVEVSLELNEVEETLYPKHISIRTL